MLFQGHVQFVASDAHPRSGLHWRPTDAMVSPAAMGFCLKRKGGTEYATPTVVPNMYSLKMSGENRVFTWGNTGGAAL